MTCCAGTASSPTRAGSRRRGRSEWGGTGWNVVQRYIFEEECGYAGAPPLIPFGLTMCAPVLLKFGTRGAEAALPAAHLPRRRFLVPGLLGARLGLRPGLAARRAPCARATTTSSTARRPGPRSRTMADWIFCLVRTDPASERKQDGISFLLIDMKTPGITVRPLIAHGRRPRGQRGVLRRRRRCRSRTACTRRARAGPWPSTCSATSA